MSATPRLNLPYIMPTQAQKHVTHNEALTLLDQIIHLQVEAALWVPPSDSAEFDRYIVQNTLPHGAWAQKEGQIACPINDTWKFTLSNTGWLCWDRLQNTLLVYTGDSWVGVNARTGDASQFDLKAQTSLFDNDGTDHRLVVNKHDIVDTASIIFQQAYTGQAEIGLNGNNDLSVRVSRDGQDWITALSISSHSGAVSIHTDLNCSSAQILDANNTVDILNLKGFMGGAEDLNDYDETGVWYQSRNVNAASGFNYPNDYAGLLTVINANPMVYQTYRVYGFAGLGLGDATFTRGRYYHRWTDWQRLLAE